MSRPLTPGQEPKESEFSPGPGMVPHPNRNVGGLGGIPEVHPTRRDLTHQLWAERRTDSTDPTSNADFFVEGNPDRFGGQPALVRETFDLPVSTIDVKSPGGIPGADWPTGVRRAP